MNEYERIEKWNKDRNNLGFHPELEFKMLMEEVTEIFKASSLAEKVQECCDLAFVAAGTVAKMKEDDLFFCSLIVGFSHFAMQYLNTLGIKSEVFNKCFHAVISANEKKGTSKDSNGKIIKGDAYTSPLPKIISILKKEGLLEP